MKKLVARVRISPAMVVAMLALFVALTGTAVATTSALITGKQIKNGSITGLDIKNKSVTSKDIKGQLRGARGLPGTPGRAGAKGDKGDPGPFPDGNLPAGKTIRGSYVIYNAAAGANQYLGTQVTFGFPMSGQLTATMRLTSEAATPQCPGTAANPQAAPGNLCLYEGVGTNRIKPADYAYSTDGATTVNKAGPSGAMVLVKSVGAAFTYSFGSWAATAPNTASASVAPAAPADGGALD